MNKNTPPLTVFIKNQFIFKTEDGVTEARLIGARALSNQALQFTVLLSNGALYAGLPVHALCFKREAPDIELEEALMWDNISNEIDVITYDLLRYMPCTVKTTKNRIVEGIYRFSIDYVGNNDLSRDPEHWKMAHIIESNEGNLLMYPQYRIMFLDPALCSENKDSFAKIQHNSNIWMVKK